MKLLKVHLLSLPEALLIQKHAREGTISQPGSLVTVCIHKGYSPENNRFLDLILASVDTCSSKIFGKYLRVNSTTYTY